MDNVITLTSDNFDETVASSTTPVLVDYWAPWCGPCRLVGPIVEEIAGERSGQLVV
ncbi:MAG TPA: thioredoxin domain-containing protein, partial [Chloroflexota bacterium]|nr:thioredoxin domain-containing protein [Chloroflexota bacterium]